jgi:hypothetical protein
VAAVSAIPMTTSEPRGRVLELRLKTDDDPLVVRAPAVDPVALSDLELLGNERIGLRVVDALVPLFGPMEIAIGNDYTDVIDGHEPVATVVERYDADLLQRFEQLAASMKDVDAILQKGVDLINQNRPVVEPEPTPEEKHKARVGLAVLAVFFGGVAFAWFYEAWLGKGAIGDECSFGDDCRSKDCVTMPVHRLPDLGENRPKRPPVGRGACSKECTLETDCPASMRCSPVRRFTTFDGQPLSPGVEIRRCVPLAWGPATPE